MRPLLGILLFSFCAFGALAAENKPITVGVGEEFEIALEAPTGVDRQWLLSKPLDEHLLKQSGRQYRNQRVDNTPPRRCEVLRYRALAQGRTELHLKFASLFEKDQRSVRTTNFVVVITATAPKSAK